MPCFRSSTVCVPHTSMIRTVRPIRAAAVWISATRLPARRLSSLIPWSRASP